MPYSLLFRELSKKDANIAGGKGASLGEMLNAGIPVPDGFVVLSTTFDEFIKQAELAADIEGILDQVDHKAVHSVEEASEQIQEIIKNAEMPGSIAADIKSAFAKLNTQYVAVRSSATAEDGAEHAWAGQLESYLNTTEESLLHYVQLCWASLFTPRAIFYRFEKGLHETAISVAVVVQQMVNSEKSGIAFSVHPVTEDRNQMIIEAGVGLGEAIVSGSVTPDSYVVEKDSRNIIECSVNHQNRALYRKEGGGNTWVDLSDREADQQVLSNSEILELGEIIMTVENHYKFPCDIEWAFEGGKFYIVQCRPITTLKNDSADSEPSDSPTPKENKDFTLKDAFSFIKTNTHWYNKSYSGYFFGIHTQAESILNNIAASPFAMPYGVLFHNKTARDHMDWFWDEGLLKKKRAMILEEAVRDKNFASFFKEGWEARREKFIAGFSVYDSLDFSTYSNKDLAAIMKELYDLTTWSAGPGYVVDAFLTTEGKDWLVEEIRNELKADASRENIEILTAPVYNSFVNDSHVVLYEIARKMLAGRVVDKDIEDYIDRYYWIRNNYIRYQKISKETVLEELAVIIADHAELETKIAEEKNRVLENAKLKQNIFKKLKVSERFQRIINVAEIFTHIQDERKEAVLRANAVLFSILEETARRCSIAGTLIFYATCDEVCALLRGEKVNLKKIEDRENNGVAVIYTQDGPTFIEPRDYEKYFNLDIFFPAHEETKKIEGSIAYKGIVKGKVRVCKNLNDLKDFAEGEILVANQTTPEYVPSMKKAAAFITDQGGITCHAAIIARELKKPCIIGTKYATQILKTGDMVVVDADKGIIEILGVEKNPKLVRLADKDWVMGVTRNMSFFHQNMASFGHFHYSKDFGLNTHLFQTAFIEDATETTVFINPDNMRDYSELLLKTFSTSKSLKTLRRVYERKASALLSALKRVLAKTDLANWHQFTRAYEELAAGLYLTVSIGRDGADKLISLLKDKGYSAQEIPAIVGAITYPPTHTPLFNSQVQMIGIAKKVQTKKLSESKIKQLLEAWLEEFKHIPVNWCEEPWNLEDAKSQLNDILKNDCVILEQQYIADNEAKIAKAKSLLKEINDSKITATAELIAWGTYLNEFRKGIFSQVSLAYRPILAQVAQQLGSDNWRDCFYLTPTEIGEVIAGGSVDLKRLITERQQAAFVVDDEGVLRFLDKAEVDIAAAAVHNAHGKSAQLETTQEKVVKGFSANKGKITGTVRVVLSSKDFHKVERGDILVTTMTSVDFVPIMERAGAFVTNEGGITSHASIVAREMNKPCIIGTQNATQILKDGDEVEVDADQGVVKIINLKKNYNTLTNVFSREKTLFYFSMWNDSDRLGYKDFLNHEIGHNLFIILPAGQKGSIWYSADELEQIKNQLENLLRSDEKKLVKKLLKALAEYWVPIAPYLESSKKIETISEFKQYYKNLVLWWSAMSAAFTIPDLEIALEQTKQSIAEFRVKSEKYSEKMNKVFTEYWQSHFPQFADLTFFVSPDEIIAIGEGTITAEAMENIKKRREGCVMLDGKIYPYQELNNILEKNSIELIQESIVDVNEVRGSVACQGLARGKVRVISALKDMNDFQAGEILVTEMTNPDYLPIMKVSAAVVTDEGGAICHAAIASRELNIPCIVGTKIATKVLHDGDEVEVDADNGVVRILQKANDKEDIFEEFKDLEISFEGGRACYGLTALDLARNYSWNAAERGWEMPKDFGCILYNKNHQGRWSWFIKDPKHYQAFIKPYLKHPTALVALEDKIKELTEAGLVRIQKLKLAKLSSDELLELLRFYSDTFAKLGSFPVVLRLVDRSVVAYCREEFAEKADHVMHIISAVDKITSNAREERDILELAARVLKDNLEINSKLVQDELKKIHDAYAWMTCGYFNEEPKSLASYQKLLAEAIAGDPERALKNNEAHARAMIAERDQFLTEHHNKSLTEFSAIASEAAYLKDYYKFSVNRLTYFYEPLFKEIAQRVNRPVEFLRDLFIEEIIALLQGEAIDETAVKERIKDNVILVSENNLKILTGDKAEAFEKFYLNVLYSDAEAPLRGRFASKGAIKGRVKIVLEPGDFHKIEEGDIIVVMNTSPDFVPILGKVGGIIAEEGGITAHVSVVSREMKIPALIGVSGATRRLHDGDEVEVDADKGIITIISSAPTSKVTLEKSYTRDTSAIIQQIWSDMLEKHQVDFGMTEFNNKVLTLHYFNDGVFEIWENKAWTKALMEKVYEKNSSNPEMFNTRMEQYNQALQTLRTYWDKGSAESIGEFQEFLAFISRSMSLFDWMYYSSLDERTPAAIRERALAMRDADVYFDMNDRFIIKSLRSLYPELAGFETGILYSEITNPPSLDILKERKKNMVIVSQREIFVGNIEIYKKNHPEIEFKAERLTASVTELKGQVGNRGYAKGRVRIMKRKDQITEGQEGEIIVSTMTTPDFVPAMKKAAGIVTDEGGITCHAAIVARELKKPCVIGTKFATQVFKDGDMVELDADKGIVRLITDNDASQEPSLDIAALAKTSWHYIHKRLRSPLFTYLLWEGVRAHHNKKVDFPYEMPLVLYLNQEIAFGTSVWDHLEEKAINHFKEDKNFLLKIMEESYRLDSNIVSLCKKFGKINWSKKSNQEIISAFKKYIDITLEAGAFLIVPLFLENYLEDFLKKIIEDSSISDKAGALHLLSSPLKQSPIQESEISLLQMAIAKVVGRSVEKSINQHIKEYGWLKNNALNGEIYTREEIERIVELLSKENPKQRLARLATERKKFLATVKKYKKTLGLTKEITRSIETLQEAIYFRSWRSERYYRNAVLLSSLYQEINKRLGVPHNNDVFYLLPEEIIAGLEKGVQVWSKLEERKRGYIIFGDKEATRIYSGKTVAEAQEKINFDEEIEHTKEITGQIAFPGKVTGRVCVVLSKADFAKVEEGDVLVTPSTTPDYVPVLKKVAAIITNEGGVLCHAAIISRELRIPCIIGTNNATKILQSGQTVEVDAEQGIVRIIDEDHPETKQSMTPVWSKLITREGVDFTTISQIDAAVYDLHAEAVKEKREIIFTTIKDRYLTHYISFDFKRLGLYLQAKYFPNVKKIINFYTEGVAFLKKTDKETKILQKKIVSGKETDLLKVYKEFRKNFEWAGYFYSMMSWIAIENWQAELEDSVALLIKQNGLEQETEKIIAPIYKPWKRTAIMEIQDKLRAGESAEKLAQEYQFMRSWVAVWFKPLTEEWIESIRGGEKTNDKTKHYSLKQAISKLKPNKEQRHILELAPYIVFLKDWRDEARRRFVYSWSFLFDILAERFKLERDDWGYLTLDEIEAVLVSGKIDTAVIARRKSGESIIAVDESYRKIKVMDQSIPERYSAIIESCSLKISSETATGKIAQKGVARGRARIVDHYEETHKVELGDILIANTTHPNYLPAMQRAAAFVTNEGGTISHAAIVAREMKKPCIVGTKNATKIFKDGDMVEVDADQGIVRLIEGGAKQELLADKFIAALGDSTLWPPLNNYSLFVFGSGYNTKKNFENVFQNKAEYNIFNIRWNSHTQTFLPEHALREDSLEVFTGYLRDQHFIKRFEDNVYKNFKAVDDLYEQYGYEYISQRSEEELLPIIGQAFDLIWESNAWSHFSPHFDFELCFEGVQSVFPKATRQEIEEIWITATDAVAESFDKAQTRDLLRNLDNPRLLEHCQYFLTTYRKTYPLAEVEKHLHEHYERFIKNPALAEEEIRNLDQELAEKERAYERWREGLSDLQKIVADYCQIVMRVRDRRKNFFAKGFAIAWRIAEKMFNEIGLDTALIENILPFKELIKGSKYIASIKEELIKRQSGYATFVHYSGEIELSYDRLAENYQRLNSFFTSDSQKETRELKGQIGNKGKIQGIVRVVRSAEQFNLFQEGEILVTGMTRPEFVPLMRRAAAIVTDEGGITCHAAIVSRELNKPCIIGTKFATHILKDGDKILVDANQGIITIL